MRKGVKLYFYHNVFIYINNSYIFKLLLMIFIHNYNFKEIYIWKNIVYFFIYS